MVKVVPLASFDAAAAVGVGFSPVSDAFRADGIIDPAHRLVAATLEQRWNVALQRLADVPIYAADALVRRAEALQLTKDARAPTASLPTHLWLSLGLKPGDKVLVQGTGGVALFATGCGADLNPSPRAPGAFHLAEQHGTAIAEAVVAAGGMPAGAGWLARVSIPSVARASA